VTSDVEVPAPLVNLTSDPVCVGVGALSLCLLGWGLWSTSRWLGCLVLEDMCSGYKN